MARIDRVTLLAAIRECVTVVEPGDALAVRVPAGFGDEEFRQLAEQAREMRRETDGKVRVIFLPGEEFALLKAGGVR